MPGSSVVVNGEWKDVASELVVVNGEWTNVLTSLAVVNGVWKNGYTVGDVPSIVSFTVEPAGLSPWTAFVVSWDVDNFNPGTDTLLVVRAGSDGEARWEVVDPPPSSRTERNVSQGVTYDYYLIYIRNGVGYNFPTTAAGRVDHHQVQLQAIPAPVLSVSGITSKTAALNWGAVFGAELYVIYRLEPSTGAYINAWFMPGTSVAHSFANKLNAEYWYQYRIAVVVLGTLSSFSNTVTFQTLSSTYEGRHYITPTKSWTFLPKLNKTKHDSEFLFHGRPGNDSDYRHMPHVTMIHYYSDGTPDPFGNIRLGIAEGLRIVKFQIWVQRRYAGPNRNINLWVSTHRNKTKPSNLNNVLFNSNNTKISDRVGEGASAGEWITLPTSLGYTVIKSSGKGIAMGRTNEPWTYWANFPRDSSTPVGKLKFVLE